MIEITYNNLKYVPIMLGLVWICAMCLMVIEFSILLFYGNLLLLDRIITISIWIVILSVLIIFMLLGVTISSDIYSNFLHTKRKGDQK